MKYKLYNEDNTITNIVGHILFNRGIKNWKKYLNLDDSVIESYDNLDNIHEAYKCLQKHITNKDSIGILCDTDTDGICSSAMMYSYLRKTDSTLKITYIMHHKAKSHGIDFDNDIEIPDGINLLIVPDAGTNDIEQCKYLKDDGIDIIILDHHQSERENPYAIIVNNQTSVNYKNKNLCGAGIVYKFLQLIDNELWQEYADDYLDLVSLANIGDVMDIRSLETKWLINKGLKNIRNKCFKALIEAQSYSMNNTINIHNIQFYIVPVINGMIRFGSFEEKELLFKAFIEQDESFIYKTRAMKDKPSETIQEDIYTRAARLCKNAKARQDKSKEKSVGLILDIAESLPKNNKVIMIDVTDMLDEGLTGVVAIKVAEKFNKPCILVKKRYDNKRNIYVYGGSARNVNNSPIESFKDVVNENSAFNFGQGHNSAFGVEFNNDKFDLANSEFNRILSNVEYDSTYKVDYIINESEIDFIFINQLTTLSDIIGQGIDEPKIAIENLHIKCSDINLIGKNKDTISFEVNGIKFIQFKCKESNLLLKWVNNCWDKNNIAIINIVGNPSINNYQGLKTLQVCILDNEFIGEEKSEIIDEDDDEW